jgi:hypothetical protein
MQYAADLAHIIRAMTTAMQSTVKESGNSSLDKDRLGSHIHQALEDHGLSGLVIEVDNQLLSTAVSTH